MSFFRHWFGHEDKGAAEALLPAIDHAVSIVDPLLRQVRGYPGHYLKPISVALEYAHALAASLPGPVKIDRESYASDAFVHALFPGINFVEEALCTSEALRNYMREYPASMELYAMMGMRRFEKSTVGMELSGGIVQHDVAQKAVYFTSHTIENPATSEQQSREMVAMNFFDSLLGRVKERIEQRKRTKQIQVQEKDALTGKLRAANDKDRPALEKAFAEKLSRLQATVSSLELGHYVEDFEAVLLYPGEYLKLNETPIILDSMGIRRASDDTGLRQAVMFNDLVGYDRRTWTVTMVHCNILDRESFASRLDKEYRRLAL